MSDYFDRIERQLVQRVRDAPRRASWFPASLGYLVPAASALVVVAVVAAFIGVNADRPSGSAASDRGALVLAAVSLNPQGGVQKSLDASLATLRRRVHAVFPRLRVSRAGDNVIVLGASGSTRAAILQLAAPGSLRFFDWEASALTPTGKTVAVELPRQAPTAITISQGTARSAPGEPGAGAMALYDAVQLAARQPAAPSSARPALPGREYYLFGTPGSTACAAEAAAEGVSAIRGQRCLLSGPAASLAALNSGLPPGVTAAEGQRLTVPPGTTVLQAASTNPRDQINPGRFYVLKAGASLTGSDITNPRPSTDPGGNPVVEFGFTSRGRHEFQTITQTIARRGAQVSRLGQTVNQHFAVAVDNQLITVPSVDFKQYPDGIPAGAGADIIAGPTRQSARILSALLRYGPLTVQLVPRPHP